MIERRHNFKSEGSEKKVCAGTLESTLLELDAKTGLTKYQFLPPVLYWSGKRKVFGVTSPLVGGTTKDKELVVSDLLAMKSWINILRSVGTPFDITVNIHRFADGRYLIEGFGSSQSVRAAFSGDHYKAGRLYSYPECCIEFAVQNWGNTNNMSDQFDQKRPELAQYHLHNPCSPNCEQTVKLATEYRNFIVTNFPRIAKRLENGKSQ